MIHLNRTLFLLLFSILISCTDQEKKPPMNTTPPQSKLNYLALGDSYTIGQSVPEEDRFPVILAGLLNNKGFDFNDPKIIAQTGWTTDELKSAIEQENIQDTYDFVSLLIGVNNQYRGRPVEDYRPDFEDLLRMAIGFAGQNKSKVVVLSIPDWGKTPFAEGRDTAQIALEIDAYNQAAKEICQLRNIKFIDITYLTRDLIEDSSFLAPDGLHYSGKMHRKWAEEIINNFDFPY